MKEDPSVLQAEGFEFMAKAAVEGRRLGEAILLLEKAVEVRQPA